jgi:DHA2 family multidrug resistance protein
MPAQDRPDGSSLLALSRSLGGSIGVSIIVTMLSRNQQVSHADIGAHVTSSMIPGFDLADVIDRLGSAGAGVMAMIDGEVNRQAMMISFLDSFVMMAIMMLVMAPLPFLLSKNIPVGGAKPAPMVD